MKKRILAVAAAMAVAAVMMFGGTVSAFADEARTADIDVSLQTGDTFLVQHKQSDKSQLDFVRGVRV